VAGAVSDGGTIEASGGLLKIAGAVSAAGGLQIDAGATLELGAATGASDVVGFGATTGTLQLDAPGSFAGAISFFRGGDIINLGGAVATGLNYNTTTKVLTVTGSAGTIANLKFNGTYTQSSFTLNPSGTEILDPPAPLTAQTVGAATATFLPPPEAAAAPPPDAWTLDPGAAGFTLPTAPAAPWPVGGAADPTTLAGGSAFAPFAEAAHNALVASQHHSCSGQ
jgi:hypothetical protein